MATTKVPLGVNAFIPAASAGAQRKVVEGTNFPVQSWAFDATTAESIHAQLSLLNYGSGNITLYLLWYADTAASGAVVWEAAIAAITPDTDTQDTETKAFASANSISDTHLGTTNQRLHQTSILISNLDSVAANDHVWLRIRRLPADAGDTMTGDALLIPDRLEYSDT